MFMKNLFFFITCFIYSSIYSYSLFLINDSPFELTAIVQSATGDFIGQQFLQPGEQKQWYSEIKKTVIKELYTASGSTTPFTVTWQCAYEGTYSVSQNIAPGSVVKASEGEGSKTCKKKPEKEEEKCPPCPACPECPAYPLIPPPEKEGEIKKKESGEKKGSKKEETSLNKNK
jgi:hypothetical protein